jgi:hypothetical protein
MTFALPGVLETKTKEQLSCGVSLDREETTAVLGYQNMNVSKREKTTNKDNKERSTPATPSHSRQPAACHAHPVAPRAHDDGDRPSRTFSCAHNLHSSPTADRNPHRGTLPSSQSPVVAFGACHTCALATDVVGAQAGSHHSSAGGRAGTWVLYRARGMYRAA